MITGTLGYGGTIGLDPGEVDMAATYTLEVVRDGLTYTWMNVKPTWRDGVPVFDLPGCLPGHFVVCP